MNLINAVTKRITPSRQGWLHGQLLDYNNLNLFCWFLAILSCLNFLLYLYSASWYKYKPDDTESNNKPKAKDSDEGLLLAKESSGARKMKRKVSRMQQRGRKRKVSAAKRNEEESAQETDDAEAKAPSSEQSNRTK